MPFVVKQLLYSVRPVTNRVSMVVGAFSTTASLFRLMNTQVNAVFKLLRNGYERIFRQPVVFILTHLHIHFPSWMPDFLLAYLFFGFVTSRSLLAVYTNGKVGKGVWGTVTSSKTFWWLFGHQRIGNYAYTIAATIFWPLIAVEYCFHYKHVWGRYMDGGHCPMFDSKIMSATSASPDIKQWLSKDSPVYSDRITYDLGSDTWWRLEGDFRLIVLGNLLLSLLLVMILVALATV